jgi:hypothetical protein
LTDEGKYELVITHLEDAKRGDPEDLYMTFSSAVDLTAGGYAETINPRLDDYLATSPPGRVGILALDYFEKPRELVAHIIDMNRREVSRRSRPTRTSKDAQQAPCVTRHEELR